MPTDSELNGIQPELVNSQQISFPLEEKLQIFSPELELEEETGGGSGAPELEEELEELLDELPAAQITFSGSQLLPMQHSKRVSPLGIVVHTKDPPGQVGVAPLQQRC